MSGDLTRAAIAAQPDWLRAVPTGLRFPDGVRRLFTGCGTSFHAAQTGGDAVQALELVLRPERDAELLVLVSHEGETPLTLEAARGVARPAVARHRQGREPARGAVRRGRRLHARGRGELVPHGELHLRGGGDRRAAPATRSAGSATRLQRRTGFPASAHERFLVAGAGRDWPTAQEAVLKLREGAFVAAEAYETEQLLHGFLAAVDESVRAFVLEGEGRAAERAAAAAAALRELGCDVTLVPTRHPAVDIVPFQKLTVALAELRGVDPDRIHRDDERWARRGGRNATRADTRRPGLGTDPVAALARGRSVRNRGLTPFQRASIFERYTKRSACQLSSIAALLLSTRPCARPISWTVSKLRSVSIREAFFGQATQSPSCGASVAFSAAKRRSSSARLTVKRTSTSTPGFAPSLAASGVPE